jgi:2-dehydropantoate 2-reductase
MGQMRYIIIGAGAVGGTIGGSLFQGGHDVVLVARGAHLDALRARGLRLATPFGTHQLDIPVVGGPAELRLRSDDVLILATKTQDAAALLADWAWQPVPGAPADAGSSSASTATAGSASAGAVAAGVLPVVCAQNGVASERFALRRFRHVYGMCVWLPATHLEPGTVEAQGAPLAGLLYVGRYPAGTDSTIERIAGDLAKSRFLAPVSTDVMRWKYAKLLDNLGNAIEALCGRGASGFGGARAPGVPATAPASGAPATVPASGAPASDAAELRRRTRAEGIAVLAAAGLAHADREELAAIRGDRVRIEPVNGATRPGGSSWQSLTRGTGTIEADFLNGEIALLGREHGVPTPVNETLQRLANEAARERRPPGFMTPAQVLAAAGVAGETPSGVTGETASGDAGHTRATGSSGAGRPSARRG